MCLVLCSRPWGTRDCKLAGNDLVSVSNIDMWNLHLRGSEHRNVAYTMAWRVHRSPTVIYHVFASNNNIVFSRGVGMLVLSRFLCIGGSAINLSLALFNFLDFQFPQSSTRYFISPGIRMYRSLQHQFVGIPKGYAVTVRSIYR